jgi:hypothetical protein
MAEGETDRLLHYMPIVVRSSCVTDWERDFCASMISKGRRKAFHPTDKQIGVMRRIVEKFQAETMADDLIERE